jgi:hypothetical protein
MSDHAILLLGLGKRAAVAAVLKFSSIGLALPKRQYL